MALLFGEDWWLRVPPEPGAAKPRDSMRGEPPLGRGAEPRASLRVEATSAQRGRQSQCDRAAFHLRCGAAIRALAEEAIMRTRRNEWARLPRGRASCLASRRGDFCPARASISM